MGTREAYGLQIVLTLIGAALPATFHSSRLAVIIWWACAALGLAIIGVHVFRNRRRPLLSRGDQENAVLRHRLLHLSGGVETLEKTINTALASKRWWDVRFNGLPTHEWHMARKVVAGHAPDLYPKVLAVYVEADQMNKTAHTVAAQSEPGGPLDARSEERLGLLLGDVRGALRAIKTYNPVDERPPLMHPYRVLVAAIGITAAITVALSLFVPSLWNPAPDPPVYVSNPLPREGFPHGTGISHADYPDGFHVDGVATPTFNSYIDNEDGSPNDERPFLAAQVVEPLLAPATHLDNPLDVRPGDTIEVSIYIRNDADSAGNRSGEGPAVATNTRVLASWNNKSAAALALAAYIFAENASPDIAHSDLKTISANLELRSQTEEAIKLRYVPNSAQYLQNAPGIGEHIPGRPVGTYKQWRLNAAQQRMLFTGFRRRLHNNTEIDAASGLPLGSDDQYRRRTLLGRHINDRKNFYGGSGYFGFVVFRARVLSADHVKPGRRASR